MSLPDLTLLTLSMVAVLAATIAARCYFLFRKYGPAAVGEDLPQARRALRLGVAGVLVFTFAILALAVAGGTWADDWRTSYVGVWALNGLLVLAGFVCAWFFRRVLHHQWSRKGSTSGLFIWTIVAMAWIGLMMLIGYWRLG